MDCKPWWFDPIRASQYMPSVKPWEWLESSESLRWMMRVLDVIAAERMAAQNRGG